MRYVLGAQKNRLVETVLLSTHNIRFGVCSKNLLVATVLLSAHNIRLEVYFHSASDTLW